MSNQTAKELFQEYQKKMQIEVNKFCQIEFVDDPMYKELLKVSAQRLIALTDLWQNIAVKLTTQKYYQED